MSDAFSFVECPSCGRRVMRVAAHCACGAFRTHRQCYPEQYSHPLCGKEVAVFPGTDREIRGVVERVMLTRFGPMARLDIPGSEAVAYLVRDLEEIVETQKGK